MKRVLSLFFMVALCARVEAEEIGNFDYYVLSMGWSPSLCSTAGGEDCADQAQRGFILRGFLPSFERGAPSFCLGGASGPTREVADAMDDIMIDGDRAWWMWKKHGSCSGLEGETYLRAARYAYESITQPWSLKELERDVEVPLDAIRETILMLNPELPETGVAVTCERGRMTEIQICLDKDLTPRECGTEILRSCTEDRIAIAAIPQG
ncbi:ribonuclease T2 family protein [Halovulum sp. GXIMD14794]